MTRPRYTKTISELPASVPFVGPETIERQRGRPFHARVGANENVFGPSPMAIAAMQDAVPEIWKYGEADLFPLRTALSAHHGVGPENIVVGGGIDGLLGSLCRLLLEPGTPVVTSYGAYPTFNFHCQGLGARIETVPYLNDHEDLDGLLAKAREVDAPLIYVANPDNPMGTWHDADAMQRMIDDLPETTVLCMDEAYVECAPEGTAPKIDVSHPRVLRMRTFSKAYGMAGARIGYAIGHPDLIAQFEKIRDHFGVSRISQAGALAALADQVYISDVLLQIEEAKARITRIAAANGLVALPSATNFVTIDCGQDGAFAKALVQAFAEHDVFIRMPFVAPQNRCIRISAGTPTDLNLVEVVFPRAIARAQELTAGL